MDETFTVTGWKHVECGGGPIVRDDGVRCRCTKCGVEETWEQAARAWREKFDEKTAELIKLRKLEENIDEFVRYLKGGSAWLKW